MIELMRGSREHRLKSRKTQLAVVAPARAKRRLGTALVGLVKDFDFLADYLVARYLVWRELRRRKASAALRGRNVNLTLVRTRYSSLAQEQYLAEIRRNLPNGR